MLVVPHATVVNSRGTGGGGWKAKRQLKIKGAKTMVGYRFDKARAADITCLNPVAS